MTLDAIIFTFIYAYMRVYISYIQYIGHARIKYSVVGANKRRKTRPRARVQVVCLPFAVLPLIVRGSPTPRQYTLPVAEQRSLEFFFTKT